MKTYSVSIVNFNANVPGMKIANGQKVEFSVKACHYSQAIKKAVQQAFGKTALFGRGMGNRGKVLFPIPDNKFSYHGTIAVEWHVNH